MTATNAIQFAEDYIKSVDSSGLLDVFDYSNIISRYWIEEPVEEHTKLLDLVMDTFGTTAYMQVSAQLNQYLLDDSITKGVRLHELNAPQIIIDNHLQYVKKLKTNSTDAHILIVMLIISINRVN
jgi:hypothetical protein